MDRSSYQDDGPTRRRRPGPCDRLRRHYDVPKAAPLSDEQVRQRDVIIPALIFKPWFLVPSSLAVQFCVGALLALPSFQPSICASVVDGADPGRNALLTCDNVVPLMLHVTLASFTIASTIVGPWVQRHGPRQVVITGGWFLLAGYVFAATGAFALTTWVSITGFGLFAGTGLAMLYVASLAPLMQWFPTRRGLVSAASGCGFGLGALVVPYLTNALLDAAPATNRGAALSFIYVGVLLFGVCALASFVQRCPPTPNYEVDGVSMDTIAGTEMLGALDADAHDRLRSAMQMSLPDAIVNREFLRLWVVFFGASIAGLPVLIRIHTSMPGKGTLALAFSDVLGRLLVPAVSDRAGRKACLLACLVCQLVGMVVLPGMLADPWAVVGVAVVLGFAGGAGQGVMAPILADMFSSAHASTALALMMTSWSTAGLLGGIALDLSTHYLGSYAPALRCMAAMVGVSVAVGALMPVTLRDRRLPYDVGEIARFRLFGQRVSVYRPFAIRHVRAAQDDKAWFQYLNDVAADRVVDRPAAPKLVRVMSISDEAIF